MNTTPDHATGLDYFKALASHKVVNLTTFRKSGEGVPTPVWFAQLGERLYIFTAPQSGKVKRIRNNSRVEIAPATFKGKPLGQSVAASARLLDPATEAEVIKAAAAAIRKRYGLQARVIDFLGRLQGAKARDYIEVTALNEG
jgi:PPOX class probable F420-dependent enzyme